MRFGYLLAKSADPVYSGETPPEELREHPILSGAHPVGIITAESPKFASHPGGNDALRQHLRGMGLKFEETRGKYENPEQSFIVHNPTREQMFQLGQKFGQEAVVYGHGGRHEMMYTNGPNTGRYHPSLPQFNFWPDHEPENYFTHIPGHGNLRLHFDWDTLHDYPRPLAAPTPQVAVAAQKNEVELSEFVIQLAKTLRKALDNQPIYPHPHSYDWHDPHESHHFKVAGHGGVLVHTRLNKATSEVPHPHMDTPPVHQNEQAAGVGVNTYAKHALPYGTIDSASGASNLMHYDYRGKSHQVNQLLSDHGYTPYYAGGKYGRPDLANKNYNTKHLMIYDPTPHSGGDFGEHEYTDNWRKVHELAHALTYPEINSIYGEGRRMGKLGAHRTAREAKRAIHWEWLAAHKQRELNRALGIGVPDETFNKELNTVMHDAVHRAVTGKFTEPSGEGFRPHAHKVPLENALGMVDEAAHNLGIGPHDLVRKAEGATAVAAEKEYELPEVLQQLAKGMKDRVEAYTQELVALRSKELRKSDEDDFDRAQARHWWLADHHSGRGSKEYKELSSSPYKPGAMENGPSSEEAKEHYNNMCAEHGCKHPMKKSMAQQSPHGEPGVHEKDGQPHGEPGVHEAFATSMDDCPTCGMPDKPGSCICLMKSEKLQKKSPPGRKEEVEKLKAKGLPASEAFGIAWKQHKEHGKPDTKKNAYQGYGPSDPGMQSVGNDGGTSGGAMLMGEKSSYAKNEMCKSCGKSHEMGKCSMDEVKVVADKKKSEDFIDIRHENEKGKRLKNIGGVGVVPGDKESKEIEAEGSGGQIKKGKAIKKDEMAADKPRLVGTAIPPMIPGKKRTRLPGISAEQPKLGLGKAAPSMGAKPPSGKNPGPSTPSMPKAGSPTLSAPKMPKPAAPAMAKAFTIPGKKPQYTMQNLVADKRALGQKLAAQAGSPKPGSTLTLSPIPGLATPGVPMPGAGKVKIAGTEGLTTPPAVVRGNPNRAVAGEIKTPPPGAGSPNPKDKLPAVARKSETENRDLTKSLGNCPLCSKSEHTGECK